MEQPILSIEGHDEIVLAAVQCARLDEDLTRRMQEEVAAAASRVEGLPVVLDMSAVEFIPSLSLGALVKLLMDFKEKGRRFILAGVQPPIRGALAVTRLDKVFEMYNTVDEALSRIRQEP